MPIEEVCTVEDIRRTCGIQSTEIEDDDVSRLIQEATAQVESFIGCYIYPKTKIESTEANLGIDSEILILSKYPVLSILSCSIDGTSVTPKYIKIYPGGKLVLTNDAEETTWDDDEPQNNIIKYRCGFLEDDNIETTTTADVTAGSSTSMSVSNSSELRANDWIRIFGTDGYSETVKISSVTDGTTIVVDLAYPHESGSTIARQIVPFRIKRLVEITTSLMMVARIVGESYKDIVGYGLEGFNVQKGEPYTQWRETQRQLNEERKMLTKHLRPNPVVI